MKQQRLRLKLLALLLFGLFALLATYGFYSINAYGNRWFAFNRNPRLRAQKQNVTAGMIYDRSGVLLAFTAEDGSRVYQADETARRAMVHLLGTPSGQVANGVETFQTNYLYGFQATLQELIRIRFSGGQRVGDDLTLTVDSRLSAEILRSFSARPLTRGKNGAAVVMNYKTGEVLALVSLPAYDPMGETLPEKGSAYYLNRVTQGFYAPGSTFKVVTLASALQNLPGAAEDAYECSGGLDVEGQVIRDFGGTSHGSMSLKEAFARSCNVTFADLALTLPEGALAKTAADFGFGDNFLFRDLVVENSSFTTGDGSQFNVAMSGFGQSKLLVTPMHMCLVAAGVANDGVIMEPTLLQQVTSGVTGQERQGLRTKEYRQCVDAATAAILQDYMLAVVESGTGRNAAVEGMTICGKTGSAEANDNGLTHGWFIGFCADEAYPFAVAVLVEDIPEGQGGGSAAAPIAADIFRWIKENYQ